MQEQQQQETKLIEPVFTAIIDNDYKKKKKIFKAIEVKLKQLGIRKYYDIENDRFVGSPNDDKKILIKKITQSCINEHLAKINHLKYIVSERKVEYEKWKERKKNK